MHDRYLEVTFRKGRVVAAYLYVPRPPGAQSVKTEEVAPRLLVDRNAAGELIGLEITAPHQVTGDVINAALKRLGQPPMDAAELAPLRAA
jgi:uncharacterized protein YuzE